MRQQAKFTLYKEGFTPITLRRWSDTEDENYYYEILCHVQHKCASGGYHERWERVKGFTNAEVESYIEKYAHLGAHGKA